MGVSILKRPIVTEKASALSKRGVYGLVVDVAASKPQICKAVEAFYQVKVLKIVTMRCIGKKRTRYTKKGAIKGRSPFYKKAFVTLRDGDAIDFYNESQVKEGNA